LANVKKLQADL